VRDASEFKEGHIPTAINIPSETFAAGSGVLPKEKKIIVYCNTGSRSYLAYKKFNSALLSEHQSGPSCQLERSGTGN